jgi:aryl-alcohol dehydrogenase-like predicted oxidoreductase
MFLVWIRRAVTPSLGLMETRNLGPDGLAVSAVGLGCMGLSQGYGPADDDESVAVLRAAIDLGVTFLDTAMSYGGGHNEELIGRAIAGRRERVVLATKFGIVRGPGGVRLDGRPERVRDYCEQSLRRLGTDHIDLYYLHRIDPAVPVTETIGAMAELVAAGKVGHLGLSECDAGQLDQAAAVHPVTAVQFEWSLTWREAEDDVIPAARRLDSGLVPYSPLGRGLLTGALPARQFAAGDFRAGDPRFGGEHLARNLALVEAIREIADSLGVSPGQLALAWLLGQGPDVVPVPGTRRPERLAENAAAAGLRLTPADLARLEAAAPRAAWAGDRQSFAAHGTTRTS